MTLNLGLKIRIREGDRQQFKTVPEVVEFIIRTAVAAQHQKMNRQAQRLWEPIQDALLDALDAKAEIVGLPTEQIEFLHDALDRWEPPAALVPWYGPVRREVKAIVDAIEAAKDVKAGKKPPEAAAEAPAAA